MSIINDALKKTQKNVNQPEKKDVSKIYEKMHSAKQNEAGQKTANGKSNKQINSFKDLATVITCVLVVTGSILFLIQHYTGALSKISLKNISLPKFSSKPKKPRKIIYDDSTLVLGGTMKGNNKIAALINGEVYEEGQIVSGKTITKISLDSVELVDNEGNVIILKIGKAEKLDKKK